MKEIEDVFNQNSGGQTKGGKLKLRMKKNKKAKNTNKKGEPITLQAGALLDPAKVEQFVSSAKPEAFKIIDL